MMLLLSGCTNELWDYATDCPRSELARCDVSRSDCQARVYTYHQCLSGASGPAPSVQIVDALEPLPSPVLALAPHRAALEAVGLGIDEVPPPDPVIGSVRTGEIHMVGSTASIPVLGSLYAVEPLNDHHAYASSFGHGFEIRLRLWARFDVFWAFYRAALEGGSFEDYLPWYDRTGRDWAALLGTARYASAQAARDALEQAQLPGLESLLPVPEPDRVPLPDLPPEFEVDAVDALGGWIVRFARLARVADPRRGDLVVSGTLAGESAFLWRVEGDDLWSISPRPPARIRESGRRAIVFGAETATTTERLRAAAEAWLVREPDF